MNYVKGLLSNEELESFLKPLQDLSYYGINKIILNFSETEKNVYINAKTENDTDRVYITYDSQLFKNFSFTKNVEFAIYNLSEFISILKHFDDQTLIEIFNNKIIVSNQFGLTLEYYSSDIKYIPHLEKRFTNIKLLEQNSIAIFEWSQNQKKNLNFFNCLSHKELLLNGQKEKSEIYFVILNKNVKTCDTVKFPIKPTIIHQDFYILFEKEKIYNILSSKKEPIITYINEKFICFYLKNQFYEYIHFVSSLKSWDK